MIKVDIQEAKDDLPHLVNLLETRQEDVVYLTRNGFPLVQLTLIPQDIPVKRIGVAEGRFRVPDEFAQWDGEIEDMLGDEP